MSTLLILGSKPDPVLPPRASYDHLACANASGRSAARLGLPVSTFTVMSAILTSGKSAPNRIALQALAGLRTETLYFYPRPAYPGSPLRRAVHHLKSIRMQPFYFKWKVRSAGYQFDRWVGRSLEAYNDLVLGLCDGDDTIAAQIALKQPSTGLMALCLGLAEGRWARFVLSGFSFEITHDYAPNPLIAERGTSRSRHAETDVLLLRHLVNRHGTIYTTEPVVHRVGVPLLRDEVEATSSTPGDGAAR
jgi:hypothetical protein